MSNGIVLSLNVGASEHNPAKGGIPTGIGKQPVAHAVDVRDPGPKTTGLHSGLVGDFIGDVKHHGGDNQAVYAYAIEDLRWWAAELNRDDLVPGLFGENLTTEGVDAGGAVIGEQWHIGEVLVLQPTFGRIPCVTFQQRMGESRWLKRFAEANRTGVYLRVVRPGPVRAGDRIEVTGRPAHGLTINEAFGIYMHDPARLARLLDADELPADMRAQIQKRLSPAAP